MQASYFTLNIVWEILRSQLCCHSFSFIVWQMGLGEKDYITVISTCLGNTQSRKHWASKSIFRQSAAPLFWDTLLYKVKRDGWYITRKNVWYDRAFIPPPGLQDLVDTTPHSSIYSGKSLDTTVPSIFTLNSSPHYNVGLTLNLRSCSSHSGNL